MKKFLLLNLLFISVAYAEEDCPPAADVAAAQNPNAFKDCDYSNTGLNGVLHRTFKKKEDKADQDITTLKTSESITKEDLPVNNQLLAKGVFNSAQQLQTLRFALIQNAAVECPKGFLLESEKYIPAADKTIKLELLYHCL